MFKPMICPNCGGTINSDRGVCEYCGTHFDTGIMQIELSSYPARTSILGANQRISQELLRTMRRLHPDTWTVDIMKTLSHQMAEKLIPFIEMDIRNEPETMSAMISGRLRVLPPDYRF